MAAESPLRGTKPRWWLQRLNTNQIELKVIFLWITYLDHSSEKVWGIWFFLVQMAIVEIYGGRLLKVSTFSLSPPTLIIDGCVFIPLRFSAFAFVIKHNDAPVSHKTFANPFFVGIFWIWSKHVSILLLHTLAIPLAETMLVGDFLSYSSSCSVLWWNLLQSLTPYVFLPLQSWVLWPRFKQDQHAPFSFNVSRLFVLVLRDKVYIY